MSGQQALQVKDAQDAGQCNRRVVEVEKENGGWHTRCCVEDTVQGDRHVHREVLHGEHVNGEAHVHSTVDSEREVVDGPGMHTEAHVELRETVNDTTGARVVEERMHGVAEDNVRQMRVEVDTRVRGIERNGVHTEASVEVMQKDTMDPEGHNVHEERRHSHAATHGSITASSVDKEERHIKGQNYTEDESSETRTRDVKDRKGNTLHEESKELHTSSTDVFDTPARIVAATTETDVYQDTTRKTTRVPPSALKLG